MPISKDQHSEFAALCQMQAVKHALHTVYTMHDLSKEQLDLSKEQLEALLTQYGYPFVLLCALGLLTQAQTLWDNATTEEQESWLNYDNFAALHLARTYEQHATVDWLRTLADEKQNKMSPVSTLINTCRLGHLGLANKLLSTNQTLITSNMHALFTPFALACENGHFKIAILLLEKMKYEQPRKDLLCMGFSRVCGNSKLDIGHRILELANLEQRQAMLCVAFGDLLKEKDLNLEMIQSLFNLATPEQQNAMLLIDGLFNLDGLNYLLDIVTPIQQQIILTSEKYAIFFHVCYCNRPDLAKRLLDLATPEQKQAMLCDLGILSGWYKYKRYRARNLTLDVIQVLLDSATTEQKQIMISTDDYFMIQEAGYTDNLSVVELILKSFHPETLEQKQAFLYAMSRDYSSEKYKTDCGTPRLLASYSKDPADRYSGMAFESACENNYQEIIKLFLDVLIPEHMHVFIKWGILSDTCDLKDSEITSATVTLTIAKQRQAILSATHYLTFQRACSQGRLEVLRALLVNHPEQKQGLIQAGFKPACMAGHIRIVKLLLRLAHETQQILIDAVVFKQVCARNNTEIAQLLLKHMSAELKEDILSANHYELFQHACSKGNCNIIQLLLNINQNKKHAMLDSIVRNTVFQTVCERHDLNLIRLLLEAANPEQKQTMIRKCCEILNKEGYTDKRLAVLLLLLKAASSGQRLEMLRPENHLAALSVKFYSPLQAVCALGDSDALNEMIAILEPEEQQELLHQQGLLAFVLACSASKPNQNILKRLFELCESQQCESQQAVMNTVYRSCFNHPPEFTPHRGTSALFPAYSDSQQNPEYVEQGNIKLNQ